MRKPLITSATACLLSASLIGCGGESNSAKVAKDLEQLLDQMDLLAYAEAPSEDNKLVYTKGSSVGGVTIPGSLSPDTAYIDQSLTLLPLADSIANNGNAHQKKIAQGIIASILADEGAYLIGVSQASYQQAAGEVAELNTQVDLLKEIIALDRALAGDRAAIIDTLKTGKINEDTSVAGINQFVNKAEEEQALQREVQAKLDALDQKIKAFRDKAAEFEALELKLDSEARGADRETRFAKLDKATTAAAEAELASTEAELLKYDVAIQKDQLALSEAREQRDEAVIQELEAKVKKVEEERKLVADKLAELSQTRSKAASDLAVKFDRLDAVVQAAGFDRMADAADRLEKAEQAFTAASPGGKARLEEMSMYVLHARALQQQAVSARSYSATLASLAAAGPEALGSGLHGKLTTRIGDMQALEQDVVAAAGELDQAASGLTASIAENADASTDEGKLALDMIKTYQNLIGSVK